MLLDAVLERWTPRIPSLSLDVRVDGSVVYERTVGMRRLPDTPARADQRYDLASLTKVLVTAPVVAALVERGVLVLDLPVCKVLPVDRRVLVRHLLTHSAGLPAHVPLYREVDDWGSATARRRLLDLARQVPLESEPGTVHCYSDIGFLWLLDLLETLSGERLDVMFERLVPETGLSFDPRDAAATEGCPVRGRVVEGEVHDLNALALGGVSTHAGLFGTAAEVGRAMAWMMHEESIAPLLRMRGPGSHRGGFDGISTGYTSTGAHFPPDTAGHLGYTGCSTWMVPSRRTVVTLLTNRIHPKDDLTAIRAARPEIHDAVAAHLGWP